VQGADADGNLAFTTVFPGCYDGRMPHVHFEVYRSLA
jgi:protocatechuate 3,4-dioxygenase beta subunit